MTVKDDRLTCDQCGRETFVDNDGDWGALRIMPKGYFVTLDLCGECVEARKPKPPVEDPLPQLQDCLNPLHVAAFLLWESGAVDDIFLPKRRCAYALTKNGDNNWRVMEIYEDTALGDFQLGWVANHLKVLYKAIWSDSIVVYGCEDKMECVQWCCQMLLDNEQVRIKNL